MPPQVQPQPFDRSPNTQPGRRIESVASEVHVSLKANGSRYQQRMFKAVDLVAARGCIVRSWWG